jgi:hypothetical protein
MRKRPGSKQSSAANPFSNDTLSSIASVSGGPESPEAAINTERTLPPLNEMGLALSMADFLRLVGFKDTNTALPVLMSFNHIEHWGFFRRASLGQLRRRGFPLPTAMQLLDGALSLEHQFTQASSDVPDSQESRVLSPYPDGVPCSPEI